MERDLLPKNKTSSTDNLTEDTDKNNHILWLRWNIDAHRPSLHVLEAFQNNKAHIHITPSTVWKATRFTGTELAPWCTSHAFVPADTCELCHHLTNQGSFLFLLHRHHKLIQSNHINWTYNLLPTQLIIIHAN